MDSYYHIGVITMKRKHRVKDKKWRGIATTKQKINEVQAKTITNRLGQKSISLPRIDDKKRWSGYPGLAGVAKKIAKLIPNCETFVEPFAGTAKVYQEVIKRKDWNCKNVILNDKSNFIVDWLKREMQYVTVTNEDFATCIRRWDSETTFFLIDSPYYKSYYDQLFSSFTKEKVQDYYKEIIELCKNMKGKFIITTRKENPIMLNSEFTKRLIISDYVVSGKYPRVMITTNLELTKGVKND